MAFVPPLKDPRSVWRVVVGLVKLEVHGANLDVDTIAPGNHREFGFSDCVLFEGE